MSGWLPTLFLAQPRWPAPCLPPDDDPRWHALSGLGALAGLGDPDGLGDGRDGGLGQHDGHQVGLAVAAVGQLGLPVGSLRQCCLDVNLQRQNIQMQSKANVRGK